MLRSTATKRPFATSKTGRVKDQVMGVIVCTGLGGITVDGAGAEFCGFHPIIEASMARARLAGGIMTKVEGTSMETVPFANPGAGKTGQADVPVLGLASAVAFAAAGSLLGAVAAGPEAVAARSRSSLVLACWRGVPRW